MTKKVKNIAVLTSGGDAPGMNAAIRAVVRACSFYKVKCFGVYKGYEGLIHGEIEELNARSVRNIINRGGTFLKSARSQDFRTEEGRKKAHDNLIKYGIDALIVIGGDEYFSWWESEKGTVLFRNLKTGYFEYAQISMMDDKVKLVSKGVIFAAGEETSVSSARLSKMTKHNLGKIWRQKREDARKRLQEILEKQKQSGNQ